MSPERGVSRYLVIIASWLPEKRSRLVPVPATTLVVYDED
jgi:hypothetical protein